MSAVATFPPAIGQYLSDYVAARRRVKLVRAALIALSFVIAWTLVFSIADRLFPLPAAARAGLLAIQLVAALAIVARPVLEFFRRRVDWIQASEQLERANPSLAQRLVTVVSQLLAPARYRGSDQILDILVAEVATHCSAPATRHTCWRSARTPALVVLALLAFAVTLLPLKTLDLPRLLVRQLQPFAALPPVTTTQIEVSPGSIDLRQRESLTIKATVRNLSGPPPVLHLTHDARQFTRTPMTPAAGGDWTLTIPAIDTDLAYHVTAGDAATPVYHIRVRRRPAVAEFRIRYEYPAYTNRPPLVIHNTDGLVEAPSGTRATVSIVATEKLSSAVLRLSDGRRLEAGPTSEPHVRALGLDLTRNATYDLELVSDRAVEGRGPSRMQIVAVPD